MENGSHGLWYFTDGRIEDIHYPDGTVTTLSNTRPVPDGGWLAITCGCGESWPLDGRDVSIPQWHLAQGFTTPVTV